MDLTTRYLGLTLRNPLVASASPLSVTLDRVVALADSGVGAIVLYSLFEEEVNREELRDLAIVEMHEHAFGEAMSYLPTSARPMQQEPTAVLRYLRLIERAAGTVDVPVIASLNGSTEGGWTGLARSMQDAGAAAIELNVYFVPGDPHTPGRLVEDRHVEILREVKANVTVPVAVKLSPHFSSPGEMALRLDEAGADGLVLFNRFLHPDVDAERMVVEPGVVLSRPEEARLPRSWIAILHGQVRASLAATTGVERAEDVAAYLLAGADVVMTASALLRHGVQHAGALVRGLEEWLARKEITSLDEVRGRLAVPAGTDATAYERAGYVAALQRGRDTYSSLGIR
ncbi:dihydroorotate dehydrogenase-like protein [Intrasporangium calvum]|uniref:Dihydroorotate dehydrogenase-like protein n=1 Tax=Intrasporangium calvum TaxID=53358 RepID=A0ABT5GIG1_9MICO|nr:dihydroorotate dehydrogenase-like protein [Intrasporangium calvum]MDC5698001.1 dihydroorotate dehydrogenase-like protein [Intrasporangium calvum]